MIGDATDEGSLIPDVSTLEEVKISMQRVAPGFSDDQVDRVIDAYNHPRPLPMHGPYFSVVADIMGEAGFICPGNRISTSLPKRSGTTGGIPRSSRRWIWAWRYGMGAI